MPLAVSANRDHRHGNELSPVACPGRGIHHTSPTDGCIHRLTVGCHKDHLIDIDHSCSAPGQRGESVLFFSHPRSEGWPHHGCTFSIYLCPLSFWLSTSWCCPSRQCVVFLACVHLTLFLAWSLSLGNYYFFFWPRYSILREEKLCYAKTRYENKLEWSLLLLLLHKTIKK